MQRFLTLAVLAVLAAGLVACSSSGDAGGGATPSIDVSVKIDEKGMVLDEEEISAGRVTFNVQNTGSARHELIVVKSDLPPDRLPAEQGVASLKDLRISGRVGPFGPNETQILTLELTPGKYVLICNLTDSPAAAHYDRGESAGLLVNPE